MAKEHPIIARDFLGLGTIGNSTEGRHSSLPDLDPSSFRVSKDCGTAPFLSNGALLNGTAFAGMRHSIWNQAAMFQYHAPSRGVQDEKFAEHSAENAPERPHPYIPYPVQSRWCGDSSVKCSPGWCDDHGLLNLGNLQGAPLKTLTPFPVPNPAMQPASFSDTEHKWKSLAETTEMQESAPLTIFYKGNVYVFNDIMAEKAQAIMLLAGEGSMQRGVIDFLGSTCMPLPNSNTSNSTADKTQVENQARCNIESGNAGTQHAGHGNASLQLDFKHPSVLPAPASPGQPSVPKALPQARKASLTRFLERRRERVQSKAPYFLKHLDSSSPEERFSSSNDIASHKLSSNMDEKRMTMSGWMERMTEFATSDLKEGSTNIAFV